MKSDEWNSAIPVVRLTLEEKLQGKRPTRKTPKCFRIGIHNFKKHTAAFRNSCFINRVACISN